MRLSNAFWLLTGCYLRSSLTVSVGGLLTRTSWDFGPTFALFSFSSVLTFFSMRSIMIRVILAMKPVNQGSNIKRGGDQKKKRVGLWGDRNLQKGDLLLFSFWISAQLAWIFQTLGHETFLSVLLSPVLHPVFLQKAFGASPTCVSVPFEIVPGKLR